MTSWFLEVPARAMGMGFAYGLGGSGRFPIQFFQIRPFLFVIFFVFWWGAGIWRDSQGRQQRNSPMVCHDRRFFGSALFPKMTTD